MWHIALIMQALTSSNPEEINSMVDLCIDTDGGEEFMHESFDVDDPKRFTRYVLSFNHKDTHRTPSLDIGSLGPIRCLVN